MPCRLILMRHAKSAWGDPGLDDHDRPLNGRGERSARALGTWLRQGGWLPDEVLCSTAARTRATLAGLALDAPARFLPALYHAAPQSMLEALAGATRPSVLMVAHNPGIAFLAEALVAQPPDHGRFADYPTGATLVVEFPAEAWDQVRPGSGRVLDFAVPRDLPGV